MKLTSRKNITQVKKVVEIKILLDKIVCAKCHNGFEKNEIVITHNRKNYKIWHVYCAFELGIISRKNLSDYYIFELGLSESDLPVWCV